MSLWMIQKAWYCPLEFSFGASHLNNRNTAGSLVQALKTYRPGGMTRAFFVYVVWMLFRPSALWVVLRSLSEMRSNLVGLLNTGKKCPWLVFHVLPACLDPRHSLPEDYQGRLCHRDRGEESTHWTTSQGLLLSDSRPGKEVRNKPQKAAVFSSAVDSSKFGTLLLEKQMNKSDQPDELLLSCCPCWRPDGGNAKEGNDGEVSSRSSG